VVGTNVNPHTISGINRLDDQTKHDIYTRLIPPQVLDRFKINPNYIDHAGNDLLEISCAAGSSDTQLALWHEYGFPDPILFGHITDTVHGMIHVLLYILNDPDSPRFDVDHMPDGAPTMFGTLKRNLDAEIAAMKFGLAPGQIRRGLNILKSAVQSFDHFILSLNHDMYFVEPLYYHNAIIFEHYGFTYEKGRRLMEKIQSGFTPGGEYYNRLDGSSPFRLPEAAQSIRLRSWAIHDFIMDEPFTGVTMYKRIGNPSQIRTSKNCQW